MCTQRPPAHHTGSNLALRDELIALRDQTAQAYANAEQLKAQWADIDKAQSSLYQVRGAKPIGY